jgi:hypothetical protein
MAGMRLLKHESADHNKADYLRTTGLWTAQHNDNINVDRQEDAAI